MTVGRGGPVDELVALARAQHTAAFLERAWHLAPADLGDVLASLDPVACRHLVHALPSELSSRALAAMPPDAHAEAILAGLGAARAAQLIQHLPDDDAADLLGRLIPREREEVLAALADRRAIDALLAHGVETAGGLMTTQMLIVSELDTVGLALEAVRRQLTTAEGPTEIFVVDVARRLVGVLSFKQLVVCPPTSVVRDVMQIATIWIGPGDDREVIDRLMGRYNVPSLPVVDFEGRLLGRVTFDDVRDAAEAEATEDLLRFGGVSPTERLGGSWLTAVKSRLPALYINLLAAFPAAAIVYFFKGSIVRIGALAIWMPLVAGMGGSAGTQGLAVSARRLSLGHLPSFRGRELIRKEGLIGLMNGAAIGVVVGAVSVLIGESWRFGLVVFLAMTGNLLVAGLVGAAIPILLQRTGRDPALASSIFVTACTDVCGLWLLLGLGTAILL